MTTFIEEKIIVHATVVAQTSGGLAYHRCINGSDSYVVTHVASGRTVKAELATIEECERFIELALPLTDWTQDMEKMPEGKTLAAQIRAIIEQFENEFMTAEEIAQ